MNVNELGEIKKDFPENESEKSYLVDHSCFLSNQFYEDLKKIYELQDFEKVIPFKQG